jgi:hypothetical protein
MFVTQPLQRARLDFHPQQANRRWKLILVALACRQEM